MNTYLLWSGIIANIFLSLTIILLIVSIPLDKILAKKRAKKRRKEETERQLKFKQELEQIKPAWQKWAEELRELEYARDQEQIPREQLMLGLKITNHKFGGYHFFQSIGKKLYFYELEEKNDQKQQEEKSC